MSGGCILMEENRDIYRALVLRGAFRILRPALWYGFFVFVLFRYVIFGPYEIRVTHIPMYIGLAIVIMLPVFCGWISSAAGVPGFSGIVEDTKIRRELVDGHRTITGRRGLESNQVLVFTVTVRDSRGKKHVISMCDPQFIDIGYIKKGDFVIHPWGCEYLEKADKSADSDILCLVCGEMNRRETERCFNCRRTLCRRTVYFDRNEYRERGRLK